MVVGIGDALTQTVKGQSTTTRDITEAKMIKLDRKRYDGDVMAWALENIDKLRPVVFLGPRQPVGWRFKDTGHVFSILESMTDQAEFERYPLLHIENALKEAASADYWYEKEKDYGTEIEDVHEDDGAYDGADY